MDIASEFLELAQDFTNPVSLIGVATWSQNKQILWSLPVVADWVKIGHDESYYSYSYGIAPELRYGFSEKLSFSLAATLSKKKYKNTSGRDLTAWSFSPSLDYQMSQDNSLRIGMVRGYDHSGMSIYSNKLWAINGSYFHRASKDLVTTFSIGYTDTQYEGIESAYTEARHDKTARVGVDLIYQMQPIASELVFSASHTKNDSNLSMYTYDRNQISLSLRKAF